jgi:hypothetical protein
MRACGHAGGRGRGSPDDFPVEPCGRIRGLSGTAHSMTGMPKATGPKRSCGSWQRMRLPHGYVASDIVLVFADGEAGALQIPPYRLQSLQQRSPARQHVRWTPALRQVAMRESCFYKRLRNRSSQ